MIRIFQNDLSRVARVPGIPGTFSQPPQVSDPDVHYGTCVTHVPWCTPRSLSHGFLWRRGRGKRSRYSRRMHNPQFYVSVRVPVIASFIYNTEFRPIVRFFAVSKPRYLGLKLSNAFVIHKCFDSTFVDPPVEFLRDKISLILNAVASSFDEVLQ